MQKASRVLLLLLLLPTIGACQHLQAKTDTEKPVCPPPASVSTVNNIQRHLDFINRLDTLSTPLLDSAYEVVLKTFEQNPTIDNRLNLAWILGKHGHAHSNPWAAKKHLNDSLNEISESSNLAKLVKSQISNLNRIINLSEEALLAKEKLQAITHIERTMEEKNGSDQLP